MNRRHLLYGALGCFILIFILIGFWVYKNKLDSYGYCPNCSESLKNKRAGVMFYDSLIVEGNSFTYALGDVYFCADCLSHPLKLDDAKIEQNLIRYNWAKSSAALARDAVKQYKKEKLDEELSKELKKI